MTNKQLIFRAGVSLGAMMLSVAATAQSSIPPADAAQSPATAAPESGDRLVWRFHADTVNDFAWATAKKFNWRSLRAKGSAPSST